MGRPKGSKNGIRRLIAKRCEVCSREFQVEPYRTNARFCSRVCQATWHAEVMLRHETRICRYCQSRFSVAPSSPQIYCSRGCASQDHGTKVKGSRALMITTKCPACGKVFSARATLHQKFCSKECADISFQRRTTLVCQICLKSFTVRAKAHRQKYCSRTCRTIGIGKTESYLEKIMARVLAENNIDVIAQYSLGPYTVDFAIPDNLIAIECDGDYWHSLPDSYARDRRKDKFLNGKGWRVIRLSETEIKTDTAHCLAKIKQALSR